MANVEEHYVVVGVAELWEESLEVAATRRTEFISQTILLRSESLMQYKRVCFLLLSLVVGWSMCILER